MPVTGSGTARQLAGKGLRAGVPPCQSTHTSLSPRQARCACHPVRSERIFLTETPEARLAADFVLVIRPRLPKKKTFQHHSENICIGIWLNLTSGKTIGISWVWQFFERAEKMLKSVKRRRLLYRDLFQALS